MTGPQARPARQPAGTGDDGQLTILLIGLLVLMVLALGWDVGNWLIGRRALNDAADGAAIAAASDLDRERFYSTAGGDVRLASARATRTVADYAELSGIDGMVASAEVDVDPDGRARVTVRATAPAATTFCTSWAWSRPRWTPRRPPRSSGRRRVERARG